VNGELERLVRARSGVITRSEALAVVSLNALEHALLARRRVEHSERRMEKGSLPVDVQRAPVQIGAAVGRSAADGPLGVEVLESMDVVPRLERGATPAIAE